jgi:hypothetical protein
MKEFSYRIIPLIGALAGVALLFGVIGCFVLGDWRTGGWLVTGLTMLYFSNFLNKLQRKELSELRERVARQETQLYALEEAAALRGGGIEAGIG